MRPVSSSRRSVAPSTRYAATAPRAVTNDCSWLVSGGGHARRVLPTTPMRSTLAVIWVDAKYRLQPVEPTIRCALSKVIVDGTRSSAPPPSMSSARHVVPVSDGAAGAGTAAGGDTVDRHPQSRMPSVTTTHLTVRLTVGLFSIAGTRDGTTG